jgi:hypothetical protein
MSTTRAGRRGFLETVITPRLAHAGQRGRSRDGRQNGVGPLARYRRRGEQCMNDFCHCGSCGLFGYRQSEKLVWFCERHRPARWWADARRDGSTTHLVFSAGAVVPADHDRQEGESAMRISEKYPRTGLFTADMLREEGELHLQISYVEEDRNMGADKPSLNVVHFANDTRELALRAIPARQIAKLHGDETKQWAGRWITLYCDETVEFNGQHGGVRVRPSAPARSNGKEQAAQPAKPDLDDEIPF